MTIYLRISLILSALMSAAVFASDMSAQRQVFRSTLTDTEYRLTLSALKTVNAAIVAEREIVLTGNIERVTFEFLPNLNTSEAWSLLSQRYIQYDDRKLYSCDGLACGSSNAWANDRFAIKQLYGLDQSQKYRVLALDDKTYLVVYFVQRGNRRIYAQVDRIISNEPVADIYEAYATMVNLFDKQGYYSLNEGFSNQQVDELVRALKIRPITKFYLVGHCFTERSEELNFACGEEMAKTLEASLLVSGIKKRRLFVRSTGELAPRRNGLGNRIDVVVKR